MEVLRGCVGRQENSLVKLLSLEKCPFTKPFLANSLLPALQAFLMQITKRSSGLHPSEANAENNPLFFIHIQIKPLQGYQASQKSLWGNTIPGAGAEGQDISKGCFPAAILDCIGE